MRVHSKTVCQFNMPRVFSELHIADEFSASRALFRGVNGTAAVEIRNAQAAGK